MKKKTEEDFSDLSFGKLQGEKNILSDNYFIIVTINPCCSYYNLKRNKDNNGPSCTICTYINLNNRCIQLFTFV